MSKAYSQPVVGRLRAGLFAIIGALCLLCITVTVTFANTVNIHDNAGVLNQSQVRSEASSLSYPIDIYTTNSFGGSTSSFDQTTRNSINRSNLIVIAIDTVHHHLAIVGGRSVSLSNSQYTDARNAFSSDFRNNNDYTSATVAAVRSLHDASSGGFSVPGVGGSSGGGIGFGTLCCIGLLVLAALAVFGVIVGRRRGGGGFFNRGFNRGPVVPPYNPNYNQYNQPYPPNYGPGYPGYNQNQGINPLAAGGLGAAAGGLLGYELGKEQGEREGDRGGDFDGGNNDGGGFGGGSSGDFGGGNNDGGGFGGGGDFGGGSSGDFGGGGDSGGGSSGSF